MNACNSSTFDLLVRDRESAYTACGDPDSALRLLPRFIGWSLVGLGAHAVAMSVVYALDADVAAWGSPISFGLRVLGAYAGALLGTQMAALPTFYLHTLLAGVRTHGWRVSVELMRTQATEATVLLGVLPIFLVLGVGAAQAGLVDMARSCLALGFVLPFLAGLPGAVGLVRTFSRLAREAPEHPHGQRNAMPILLALAWSGLFTFMAPVGVWGIWHASA